MKILKVWYFWQDKLKYHDHYLAAEMHKLRHETTFLAPNRVEHSLVPFVGQRIFPEGISTHEEYRVIRLNSIDIHGKFLITNIHEAASWIKKDFEIIHIFGISNFITFITLTFLLFRRRKPLIFINDHNHPHDHKKSFLARSYHALFRILFRLYSPMVARVIVPNLATKNYLSQRYKIHDDKFLKIIPLGFNQDIFNINAGQRNKENNLVICFAGKIYPEKRLEVLLNAIKKIDANHLRLIIAGTNPNNPSPYQRTLINYASQLEIKNIEFKPFIDNPVELAKFYAFADLAVFPGSLSITTLEANGCGTPIILYRSTEGLEDRVENGRGLLFATEEELVSALNLYIKYKQNNNINYTEVFNKSQTLSWKNITQQYLAEYRSFGANC